MEKRRGPPASDQNVRSRISTSELIDTSANANDAAIRKLASAYTMVADLGTAKLSQGAFQKVVDKATQLAVEAIQGLTMVQASLGNTQQRVTNANSRMTIQSDIMTNTSARSRASIPTRRRVGSPHS